LRPSRWRVVRRQGWARARDSCGNGHIIEGERDVRWREMEGCGYGNGYGWICCYYWCWSYYFYKHPPFVSEILDFASLIPYYFSRLPKPNLIKEKQNRWIEEVKSNTWQEGCFFSATVVAYVSYTHIVVPETHMVKQNSQDHNSRSLRWMFICPKCSKASAIYSWHLILMHDHRVSWIMIKTFWCNPSMNSSSSSINSSSASSLASSTISSIFNYEPIWSYNLES